MASMQQIIVKITGQDNLSPILAKIAKSMGNVDKSGKQLSTSFTSSLKQMERNSSKTANQINQSLNKANKIQFKALSGGFKSTVKQMETQSQAVSKNITQNMDKVNKTQFKTLAGGFDATAQQMEAQAQNASKIINSSLETINKTKFQTLGTELAGTMKGMETQAQAASKTIDHTMEAINKTQFKSLGHNFDGTMKGMERLAQSTTRSITSSFSGLGTAIAGLGIGMGASELFNIGKERAVTGAMLKNRFGAQGPAYLDEYYKYTKLSSTPDFQVNRLYRGAIGAPGAKAENMGGLLKASDALSTTGDVDDFKLRLALMDYMATGSYKRLADDFGSDTAKWLGGQWDLANQKKDPMIIQNAMEYLAKHLGRMSPEGEALTTTFEGEMGAYNKTLAALDNIVQSATKSFNTFLQVAISPLIDLLTAVDNATGGFLTKLCRWTAYYRRSSSRTRFLGRRFLQSERHTRRCKGKDGKVFGKKLKLDMDCGVCPPGSLLGGQGGLTPVPGGGGKIPTVEKGTKGKGRLGGVGRSLGAITRLSGRAGTALRGVASAVGLLAVAETAAAVAGSAMFLPIIAGAAAAGIAIYALTAGMRSNADTMRGYNDALKNGEKRINELKGASESYKKKVTELTAEKNKLKAAGKDVGYIEKEIQDARYKSAQAARDAARAEQILKQARESHQRITTESTTDDTDYTTNIGQKLRETGRYSAEELETLDKQNASLRDGTALRQHGLNEKKRVHSEGTKFITDITEGKNAESEAWLKDKKAIDEYATGMDSLAKLEEKYMNSDSWTEKIGIWFEQGITKMQVGWINLMVVLGKGFPNLVSKISSWLSTIDWAGMIGRGLSSLVNLSSKILNWISKGLDGFEEWLSTVLAEKVVSGVTGAVDGAAGGVTEAGGKGGHDFIGGMIKWMEDNGPKIADVVATLFIKLAPLLLLLMVKIGALVGKKLWDSIKGALSRKWDAITKPFRDAWNNAMKWLHSKWRAFTQPIINAWNNYVVKPLIGTYNWIKQKWHETMSWLGTQWNTYVQPIIAGAAQLGAALKKTFDDAVVAAQPVLNILKDIKKLIYGESPGLIPGFKELGPTAVKSFSSALPIVGKLIAPLETTKNIIYGQSPGLLPGFKKLGREVPRQISKTLPYLESLSSAMAIPSTSLEVSAIPSLDSSALDSLTVPLTSAAGGGYGNSSYSSMSTVSTIYNDHNHYHEPITINAKDMSLSEFKSTLISVLEEGKQRYTPP